MATDWLETLSGFRERSYDETQKNLEAVEMTLRSRVNQRTHAIGELKSVGVRGRRGPTSVEVGSRPRTSGGIKSHEARRRKCMQVKSPYDIAHGLNERLKLGLTSRPWNMHSPADTLWWLLKSTDWPAYEHGKLVFSFAKDDARRRLLGMNDSVLGLDMIFAGFNVEKGYGSVARQYGMTGSLS